MGAIPCRFDSDQRHMSFYRTMPLNPDKNLQAYIIGLAVGDGNLSNQSGRAVRLRISCDDKYPNLRNKIISSLKLLLPQNGVGTVKRKSNCTDVYVHSNHLENLLGWKALNGSKFSQNVSIPEWILENTDYKIKCLKGLIETDGSIYIDRGYKMVIFSTIIEKLANSVQDMILSLGFKPHKYKIPQKIGAKFKYQVRLSKSVDKFLDLVKPEKN